MKINKLKVSILALVAVLAANTQAANVDIGSFATGSFTVDPASTYTPTQSGSGLTTSTTVTAGDTFYGNFTSPKNWSSYGFSGSANTTLGLLMSVSGTNPNLFFTVTLQDSTFTTIESYSGSTAGLSSTPSFLALTPDAGSSGGGLASDVSSFVFGWNGGGNINTTLVAIQSTVDLAAVPEPSVASLFALGTVGLVALRARRKS